MDTGCQLNESEDLEVVLFGSATGEFLLARPQKHGMPKAKRQGL
jgi:hypothetical protein